MRRCRAWQLGHAIIYGLDQPDEATSMARTCEVCGKGPTVGRQVSHAHNVSARRFRPNLQEIRVSVNGGTKRMRVCTRCLRSGKVTKAA